LGRRAYPPAYTPGSAHWEKTHIEYGHTVPFEERCDGGVDGWRAIRICYSGGHSERLVGGYGWAVGIGYWLNYGYTQAYLHVRAP